MSFDTALRSYGPRAFTSPCPSIAQSLPPNAIRHDKSAVELLIAQVQSQAMHVMLSVPLAPDEKKCLAAYVTAGPVGWVWSPPVAQGLAPAQVRMANGWRYEVGRTNMLHRGCENGWCVGNAHVVEARRGGVLNLHRDCVSVGFCSPFESHDVTLS